MASSGYGDGVEALNGHQESTLYSAPGSGGETTSPVARASGPPATYKKVRMAHAIIGTLAFAFFFPLGSIIIRSAPFRSAVWLHAGWQLLTLSMAITTMGMGIYMARDPSQAHNEFLKEPHVIIGLVVICVLLAFQPATGILQHLNFRRTGRRTGFSYGHLFLGVPLVTLGAINGGLGLQLSDEPGMYYIPYAVLASLVWVTWMSVSSVSQYRRRSLSEYPKPGRSDKDAPAMKVVHNRSAKP